MVVTAVELELWEVFGDALFDRDASIMKKNEIMILIELFLPFMFAAASSNE